MKKIGGTAVFRAAVVGELLVILLFLLDKYNIIGLGFLWLNVAGALIVVLLSACFSFFKTCTNGMEKSMNAISPIRITVQPRAFSVPLLTNLG